MRQRSITEFDAYPHAQRDRDIVQAIFQCNEAVLRPLLRAHRLTLDSRIRVYAPDMRWDRWGTWDRLDFQGFVLEDGYQRMTLADFVVHYLNSMYYTKACCLVMTLLQHPVSSVAVLSYVLSAMVKGKTRTQWTSGNPYHLFTLCIACIQAGAKLPRSLPGAPMEQIIELHDLVKQRNWYRIHLRILVGIARFRHRRAVLPHELVAQIAAYIKEDFPVYVPTPQCRPAALR